jgi:hypothetical protein
MELAPLIAMDDHAGLDSSAIRERLMADHRRLDALLDKTLAAVEANDREAIAEAFTEFEAGLRAHIKAEERFLIPVLLSSDPRAGRAIMADHRHIRSRLVELGAEIDLHTVRLSSAKAFAGELRAHASHEDKLLYRWADEHVGESERTSLFAELADKIRSKILSNVPASARSFRTRE